MFFRRLKHDRTLRPQAMDAMLDHVEVTCEVSFALDGIIDKVEGANRNMDIT